MLRDSLISPSEPMTTYSPFPETVRPRTPTDALDDIFGSAPSSPTTQATEPSDIPRIRSQHSAAGYRDGITAAKSTHIQAGFDEGYSLGAVIGLRIGTVLGTLEGILAALKMKGHEDGQGMEKERMRASKLLAEARQALATEKVFGAEWWGQDGIWTFEVEGEDDDVTFEHVVDAHPIIRRWEGLVKEEVERWGLDLEVLERGNVKRLGDEDSVASG